MCLLSITKRLSPEKANQNARIIRHYIVLNVKASQEYISHQWSDSQPAGLIMSVKSVSFSLSHSLSFTILMQGKNAHVVFPSVLVTYSGKIFFG